jgi:hypothetical protein
LLIWSTGILGWLFWLNSELLLLIWPKKYIFGNFSFFMNVSTDLFKLKSLIFIQFLDKIVVFRQVKVSLSLYQLLALINTPYMDSNTNITTLIHIVFLLL